MRSYFPKVANVGLSRTSKANRRRNVAVLRAAGAVVALENRILLSKAHLLVDANDASPDSNPNNFVSFGGNEYFFATIGTTTPGEVFEKTDGTAAGTSLVKSLGVEYGAAGLQVDNGVMSFTTPTTAGGPLQLWVSD